MKTSVIRHPKFSTKAEIYTWQVEILNGDLLGALILSFLEYKMNHRPSSVIEVKKSDLMDYIFNPTKKKYQSSMNNLIARKLIYTDINKIFDNEFNITFDAKLLNKLSDQYNEQKYGKPENVELSAFAKFLMVCDLKNFRKKQILADVPNHKVQRAREVFNFWKTVSGKSRAKENPKTLKMIIDRIDEDYSEEDMAQACIGILYSDHHQGKSGGPKYDDLKYILGDAEKLNRMASLAESNGYNLDKIRSLFKMYKSDPLQFAFKHKEKTGVNEMTGEKFV